MEILRNWFNRQLVNGLIILLVAPLASAAPAPRQQQAALSSQRQGSAPAGSIAPATPKTGPVQQPTKPAPTTTQQTPALPNSPTPVGTAAAPYEKPVGAAVSRPAGAAIAPAKQKRRRSILIRTGLVIGAAIAIGTVVALSKSSPNRPNN